MLSSRPLESSKVIAITGSPVLFWISPPSTILYMLIIRPSSIIQFTSFLFNDLNIDKIFSVESLPFSVALPNTIPSITRSRRITTPASVDFFFVSNFLKLSAIPKTRIPFFLDETGAWHYYHYYYYHHHYLPHYCRCYLDCHHHHQQR